MSHPDSPLLSDPTIVALSKKYSTSPATILISYQNMRDIVVLPKSVTPARIKTNLELIDIDESDMLVLDNMAAEGKQQRVNTPAFGWDLVSHGFA